MLIKIDKSLRRSINKKKITSIRNKDEQITMEPGHINKLLSGYYKQVYASKEIYNLSNLIQEEIENLNSSVTQNKLNIYNIIKNLTKKTLGSDDFISQFHHLRKK